MLFSVQCRWYTWSSSTVLYWKTVTSLIIFLEEAFVEYIRTEEWEVVYRVTFDSPDVSHDALFTALETALQLWVRLAKESG